jgi:hypothetical protein
LTNREPPRYWLYTLDRGNGMTLHAEGVCQAQRRKSTRWTGPLTLAQVQAMHPQSFWVCDRCLSEYFTTSPRWPRNAEAKALNAIRISAWR